MSLWVMMVVAGLATFGTRALFSVLPASWQLPSRAQEVLGYLPVAVFAALAAPGLLRVGSAVPPLSAGRLLAVVVGGYVAWHTRSLLLAVFVGMVVLWLGVWIS
jgi:branched-subunit amino acid transport protein